MAPVKDSVVKAAPGLAVGHGAAEVIVVDGALAQACAVILLRVAATMAVVRSMKVPVVRAGRSPRCGPRVEG